MENKELESKKRDRNLPDILTSLFFITTFHKVKSIFRKSKMMLCQFLLKGDLVLSLVTLDDLRWQDGDVSLWYDAIEVSGPKATVWTTIQINHGIWLWLRVVSSVNSVVMVSSITFTDGSPEQLSLHISPTWEWLTAETLTSKWLVMPLLFDNGRVVAEATEQLAAESLFLTAPIWKMIFSLMYELILNVWVWGAD